MLPSFAYATEDVETAGAESVPALEIMGTTEVEELGSEAPGFAAPQKTQLILDDHACGENLTWSLVDGTLSISGTGRMFDYTWNVADGGDEGPVEYVDSPWFDQRESITRIVVEDGVTSIGANAFASCWMANDIFIADSVTDIGEGALDGCGQDYSAALLADSTPIIPSPDPAAGNVRYSVLALDISGSMSSKPMTAQKAAAIKFCKSILSADGSNYVAIVTFGSSTKTVSSFSSDIDALTAAINGVRLSGSTNTVGALILADELLSAIPSSAGRSIILCSDGLPNVGSRNDIGPFTSADSSSYRYANSVYDKAVELMQSYDLFTLGFFHSLNGKNLEFARKFMSTIQNSGYYEVVDPEDLEFTFGDIAGDVVTPGHSGIIFTSVPKDKYLIHVVDEEGRNLQGVTVTCNGTPGRTNNNGFAQFDRSIFAGTPKITATASGYIDWTNEQSSWEMGSKGYATIKMFPVAVDPLKLTECIYSNDANMSTGKNLLIKTKVVNLGNDVWGAADLDFGEFYLTCKAVKGDEVTKYEFWQGLKKIKESKDGNFGKLSVDKDGFVEGGQCFIRTFGKNGSSLDTRINLKFETVKINENFDISFTGGNSTDLGQLSFKVNDDIPFVGGGTFDVSIPGAVPAYVDFSPDGQKIQIGINVKKEKEFGGSDKVEKSSIEQVKEIITDARTAGNLPVAITKKNLTQKQQDAFKKLQKKYNKLDFFKKGSVDVLGYLEGDLSAKTVRGHLVIKGTIQLVDFNYTAWCVVVPVTAQVSLDAGGQAIGELGYDWENAQWTGFLDLGLFANLKAFGGVGVGKAIGVGVYGSAGLEGQFRMIGTPWGLKSVDLTGELGFKAYIAWLTYEKAFAYNTWHLYTANNVKAVSEGENSGSGSLAMYDADTYHVHDLGYLSEESEWMGTPTMMLNSSATLLDASASTQLSSLLSDTYRNARPVMIAADHALYAAFLRADSANGDVYTVVTKYDGTGSWATPVRVDPSAILDAAPSLCVDADGTLWLAYAKTAADCGKTDLLDYASKQSVVVGTIDPDTLAFTEKAAYPGTGYAHLQQLSMVNGIPTLVWADSAVTDEDSVLWPTASDLYTAVYVNGNWGSAKKVASVKKPVLQLAAGVKDGNLSVAYVADRDGTPQTEEDQDLYIANRGTPVATGVQGKVSYTALPGQAEDFVWNAENSLKTAGGAEIPAEGISREYAMVGNRVYYSVGNEKGANLRTVIYDESAWSGPVDLTGGERYLENVSAVRWNGNDYVMGMDTRATINSSTVSDAKNLVWGPVRPTSNLRLDDLDYNANGLSAGVTVPVKVTVTNAGDHVVNSVDVSVNGSFINSYPCTIASGASAEFNVDMTCPATLTEYTFEVAEAGMDDFTPEDNTTSIGIGYADIAVSLEEERVGGQSSLVVCVTNEGVEPATGSVVVTDTSGKPVQNTPFTNLEAGGAFVASYPMKKGDTYTVSASLLGGKEDLYTYNNTGSLPISAPDGTSEYTITFSAEGGTVTPASGVTDLDGRLVGMPTPVRRGYTFNGWYTAAEGGTLVSAETVFEADTTIYAQWKASSSGGGSSGGGGGGATGGGGGGGGGLSVSRFAVMVPSGITGGSVRASSRSAAAGSTITLTVTHEQGYALVDLRVKDAENQTVTLKAADGGKYTFTMPSSNVTVEAVFQSVGDTGFVDVPSGTYYHDAVAWAVKQGVTVGTGTVTFSPDAPCTRAQIVTFLWRTAGSPKGSANCPFTDVPADSYYYDAVLWAVEEGITTGTSATTFSPDVVCTRAQAVTFLYRREKSPAANGTNAFTDVALGAYYTDAVQWAVTEGITTGTSAATFSPDAICTRAQIVTFLNRDMA